MRYRRTVQSFASLPDLGQAVDQLPADSIKRVQPVIIEFLIVSDELQGLPPRRPGDYLPEVGGWTTWRSQVQMWRPMAIVLGVASVTFAVLGVTLTVHLPDVLLLSTVGVCTIFFGGVSLRFVSLARGPAARLWRDFEAARRMNLPQRLDELRSAARSYQAAAGVYRRTNRTSAST
jgi:hypothetical protein